MASVPLRYPVRLSAIAALLSRIAAILALLTIPPLVAALASRALLPYLLVLLFLGLCGLLGRLLPLPRELHQHEGLIVVALSFLLPPFLLAYPLAVSAGFDYQTALFEALSGITTTGLSLLPSVEGMPRAFLFARAWMQWYGGLGVVLLLPLLLEPGPVARRLVGEEELPSASPSWLYVRRIALLYLFLTALAFLLLWPAAGDPFTALVHALAAVSTGGFSSLDSGLHRLGLPFAALVLVASLLGALPLILYRSPSLLFRDSQVRALLLSLLLVGLLVALSLWQGGRSGPEALLHGLATALSAQTTAGFATLPVSSLPPLALAALLLAMVSGGCVGSTAGGIKWLRLLIFFKVLRQQLLRATLPAHAWLRITLDRLEIEGELACRALALALLYQLSLFLSWLPFLALGEEPLRSLFEVASALGTVGLTSGITGPDLPPPLRWVLMVDMWAGRIELFAALVLLNPATWRKVG